MVAKVFLSLILLILIAVQCFFIHWLGGYDPKELNRLLQLWQDFGVEIVPYTAFMLEATKKEVIWLIPIIEVIASLGIITTNNWYVKILTPLIVFVITIAVVFAVYNPQMMVN